MKEVAPFPADLSEHDRRLMVNAVMIVAGQFGATKIKTEDGLWSRDHNAIVERLGVKPRWGVEHRQPACAHGCAPAFLDENRADSCWKCGEEILRKKIAELEAEMTDAEKVIRSIRAERDGARNRVKYVEEGVAKAQKSLNAIYRKTEKFVTGNLYTVKRDAVEGITALALVAPFIKKD